MIIRHYHGWVIIPAPWCCYESGWVPLCPGLTGTADALDPADFVARRFARVD